MSEQDKTELLIRIDERLKNIERIQIESLIEAKKTNGRITTLETWKTQVLSSIKTVSVLWGIAGVILGGAATVFTMILKKDL